MNSNISKYCYYDITTPPGTVHSTKTSISQHHSTTVPSPVYQHVGSVGASETGGLPVAGRGLLQVDHGVPEPHQGALVLQVALHLHQLVGLWAGTWEKGGGGGGLRPGLGGISTQILLVLF